MKIAFLMHRVPVTPSGGVKVIFEYANYMAAQNNEVVLYYKTESFMQRYRFVPKFVKNVIAMFYMKFLINWFPLHKNIKNKLCYSQKTIRCSDIIIATEIRTVEWVYGLPKENGKKVYLIQDFEDWHYPSSYVYKTYGYDMLKIVVSNWLKQIVDEYSNEPSFLVSNGIDSNVFFDKRVKRDSHSIVFHYREAPYKGCCYAIKAIEKLKRKYDDLTVNVISSTNKIPKFPDYYNVYISISPEEVADINNQSEVFICSSIKEGFGLPGLEAMACGCVLVSSKYEGVMEYAVDNYNALLVEPKDVDGLVNKTSLIFENPDLKNQLQRRGIESSLNRTVGNAQERFCEILQDCLKD